GNETFFPPYMADRNRRWIMEQFDTSDAVPEAVAAALVERLATLSSRFFAGQREDLRRALVALQLADLGLRDPQHVAAYSAALDAAGLPGAQAAAATAQSLVSDLSAIRTSNPTFDQVAYRRALDSGLKALGFQNAFEVQTLKSG
ncbi:MAG TPA: hypothetical protein VM536_05085, partial [Chloroflexia bacterium]|nr:hypothetical protein [Chloroflexia bacterium]